MISIVNIRRFFAAWFFVAITFNFAAAGDKAGEGKKEEANASKSADGIAAGSQKINLIKNPGFENRTSNWTLAKLNGGTGVFKTDTVNSISGRYSARLELKNHDKEFGDVHLFTSLPLAKNTLYTIEFQARVMSPCHVTITIGNEIDTHADFGVMLQPHKQHYGPFLFESQLDDPLSSFAFNLGKATSFLLLDEVQVESVYAVDNYEEALSRSGVNFHIYSDQESIMVKLPEKADNEYPVLFQNEKGSIVQSGTIGRGILQKQFLLPSFFTHGAYTCKVFLPEKTLTYSFKVK